MFPILGHPTMWPDAGFVELPVGLGFRTSIAPLPEHAALRAMNRATDEKNKKVKDDKKVRQWVKLDQGKWQQGSHDEEEEEEEGSGSPI